MSTAVPQAKAGNDLVIDQDDTARVGDLAHGLEVSRFGQDAPGIAHHGFGENRRDRVAFAGHRLAQGIHIVPRQNDQLRAGRLRQSGPLRDGDGMSVRPRLIELRVLAPVNAVGKAVIHALEADDFLASGEGPCQANRIDDRFGAGIAQPHLLHARHRRDDSLREPCLLSRRQCEHRAAILNLLHDRCGHFGRTMSENHRTQAQQVVDIGIAVDVVQIGALAAIHEQGIGIPTRPDRTGSAVDAGGNGPAGHLVEFGAAREARGIVVFHRVTAVLENRKNSHP